jgi:hypothetical protein
MVFCLTALESGAAFQSIRDRLGELEAQRAGLEAELARVGHEAEQARQRALSVDVLAESYQDFPAMLDQLRAAGDWQALKDLMGRYVEVLDWQQDSEDPTAGRVDIMLFEQALPAGQKHDHPDAPGYVGASGWNRRLPK